MIFDDLAFWVIAVPIAFVASVASVRYARANHRWFSQVAKADPGRPANEQELTVRVLKRSPRRLGGLYYFVYAILSMILRGPLFMFREDKRNPELEALRRESVARYKPFVAIVAVGAAILLMMFIGILIFLALHAVL